ncbi:MAG: hypothetical protein F4X11_21085 [Acidobacteria bacterium]|nr:hypothetical protein [Acidobacteriota bacterium]
MHEHRDDWAKVKAALANPNWDFRTVDGIARETSLPREHVQRLIRRHEAEVRMTLTRDSRVGTRRVAYTLRDRPTKLREFVDSILTFASQ